MATANQNQFEINGVIDTNNNVLDNINTLCTASGTWMSYDVNSGQWSVIINGVGSSIASFDDSNILGNINISGTPLNELYNSATIEYPHRDLNDAVDYVDVEIASGDRFANERDNRLNIKLDCINNPVQAQYIATAELKQSRVNKVIEFTTDYSKIGLKAGDLIDVTSDQYGFTNKIFRIIRLVEQDSDDGELTIGVTGLEYDADVYSTTGLTYEQRTKRTGIVNKISNEAVETSDNNDFSVKMSDLLVPLAATSLFNLLFDRNEEDGSILAKLLPKNDETDSMLGGFKKPALNSISATSEAICEEDTVTITVGHGCQNDIPCLLDMPTFDYEYEITGVDNTDIDIDTEGFVSVDGETGEGTLTFTAQNDSDSEETATVTIGGQTIDIVISPILTETFTVSAGSSSITEGGSTTITLTTSGIGNGSVIDYEITGSGTDRVTTALTGTVTVNSNTATLTLNTDDDGVYTGTQTVNIAFDVLGFLNVTSDCGTGNNNSATVSILDNDTQPPADTTCEYTLVPIVWCGVFDGTTGVLKDVTIRRSAYLPVPQNSEPTVTVPLTCSVSGGAMSIDSTVDVASSSSMGGIPYQVITAFNSVPNNGLITGSSTTTVYGYDL